LQKERQLWVGNGDSSAYFNTVSWKSLTKSSGTPTPLHWCVGARRFRDVIAWQLARELRRELRTIWQRPSVASDFKLTNQLRDAARTVTANIAEGFPCSHAEFARFLQISYRSLEEIEDRLIAVVDDKLVSPGETEKAFNLKKRTSIAVSRLRWYLLATPDPPNYKPAAQRQRRRRT
jgi:four helix bundle protein